MQAHGLDVGIVTGSDGFGEAIAPVVGERGVDMIVDNADLMPALAEGRIRPIIDRCFPLDQLPAAQAHVEADCHVGKVVIQV